MLDATLSIPAAIDRLVVLLILIIRVLSTRLAAIHAVEAHAVEVSQRISLRFQHNSLPIDATAAGTFWCIIVVKSLETAGDLNDARVAEDIVDRPGIALGKGEQVTTDSGIPA